MIIILDHLIIGSTNVTLSMFLYAEPCYVNSFTPYNSIIGCVFITLTPCLQVKKQMYGEVI